MDLDGFWALLEEARDASDGDVESVAQALVDVLAEQSRERICQADQEIRTLLAQAYGWPVWGAAYLINGGASDDGFEYFLGWLIAEGSQVFNAALADPDSLAEVVTKADFGSLESEALLQAPWDAYIRVFGGALPVGVPVTKPELGEGWDFDDQGGMRRRYPRLAALFL